MGLTAAPGKLIEKPFSQNRLIVYAYENEPYANLDTSHPGFLIELSLEILRTGHPDVSVDISQVKGAMKYSLFYGGGVVAVGIDKDFTDEELGKLHSIPLYEDDDSQYKLFFNRSTPQGEELYEKAGLRLEQLRGEGEYDRLLKKYDLPGEFR